MCLPFLALRFSYSYSVFDNSVIFCLSLIFFEYYLALVYWASLYFSPAMENFQQVFLQTYFYEHLPFPGTPIAHRSVRSVCIVPHVIKALFIFSHFYFLHASVWIDFYCCVFSHSAFIHNAEFMDTEGWLYYVILYEELKHLWILRDNYSSLGPMSSRLFK